VEEDELGGGGVATWSREGLGLWKLVFVWVEEEESDRERGRENIIKKFCSVNSE
jgi:hypothetical protein